tara:strand:+ start:17 stop:277 length:261 start_codon:yes stop_codon:yes gene_type:complete
MILDTYFLVRVHIDKHILEYGPYLELEDAVCMLVDHLPSIIMPKVKDKGKTIYKAEVHECMIGREGDWETVAIRITENECERKFLI